MNVSHVKSPHWLWSIKVSFPPPDGVELAHKPLFVVHTCPPLIETFEMFVDMLEPLKVHPADEFEPGMSIHIPPESE